ncbi:MAG: hypothetical protein ABIQ43_06245 [Sphingomonas sp.]
MRWLIGLSGLLAIGAAAAPAPRTIAPATFVEWKAENGPRSFRSGDVTVRVAVSGKDGDSPPAMTISAPGVPALRIVNDDSIAHYASTIAIGPLVRGQPSSVVVQTYTGGAHCCMHVAVALRSGKTFRLIDLGEWDGNGVAWPKDVSGDGIADFQFVDNAFLYAFGSYADSWPPPLIMTIRAGKAVNVSTEPAYRPLFEANMARAGKACFAADANFAGGPCAGFLAAAARLGEFEAAWAKVARTTIPAQAGFPDNCQEQPPPNPCYRDFATGVRAFLHKQGYLR